ncbi:HEAT repeat protein [Kitasatospora sp. MAA4]|uniref:hypothetical protein n=1 Tax=Kitasatospora sp. MAA4 TaxID=3035093 RepID=UPI002473C7E4|nr:hypothetical protein [Kitasatospora sp. MAA4]MDH6130684.1 HEAT repeat protein [Kitasatospora sp. MAA4]
MSTAESGWDAYRAAMFGDPYLVWHEGVDLTALAATTGAAREEAVRMLLVGLRAGDPVAAQGLRELRPVEAVPALREAAEPGREPGLRVRAAQALLSLTGDQDWARPVADVLDSTAEFWGVRIDAAAALRDFAPTPALVAALVRAAQDPEYLVRYHASSTLLAYAGRKRDVSAYRRWFPRLAAPPAGTAPTDEHRAAWQTVAGELAAAVPVAPAG